MPVRAAPRQVRGGQEERTALLRRVPQGIAAAAEEAALRARPAGYLAQELEEAALAAVAEEEADAQTAGCVTRTPSGHLTQPVLPQYQAWNVLPLPLQERECSCRHRLARCQPAGPASRSRLVLSGVHDLAGPTPTVGVAPSRACCGRNSPALFWTAPSEEGEDRCVCVGWGSSSGDQREGRKGVFLPRRCGSPRGSGARVGWVRGLRTFVFEANALYTC